MGLGQGVCRLARKASSGQRADVSVEASYAKVSPRTGVRGDRGFLGLEFQLQPQSLAKLVNVGASQGVKSCASFSQTLRGSTRSIRARDCAVVIRPPRLESPCSLAAGDFLFGYEDDAMLREA